MSQKRKDSKSKLNISQKQSPDQKDDLSESRIITKKIKLKIEPNSKNPKKQKKTKKII